MSITNASKALSSTRRRMAAPEPPPPPCRPLSTPSNATPTSTHPPPSPPNAASPTPTAKPPLTGFRSSLEHTGIPRSVLTWRPRLPSRNWSIFITIVSTISYFYYDDRRQCRLIKARTLDRVKHLALEPMKGSLDLPRKVKVIGARWPEDDDDDRALRYFRKYVKPYLVAAAVDYEQLPAPLHGSVTRQTHASILRKRRRSLGLEATPPTLDLPGTLDPAAVDARELEGGVVLVGRASLKEYMEGLKRGWKGGVGEWEWEKEVEEKLKEDGVFESPIPTPDFVPDQTDHLAPPTSPAPPPTPSSPLPSGLSFLSRPPPPLPPAITSATTPPSPPIIPSYFHTPPSPLPPHPPILLLPFVNHLGFKQFPYMIYDYFTERHRVQSGSDAALALIFGHTRPLTSPDLDFDRDTERWYNKSLTQLPERIVTARKDYYAALEPRLESARALEKGERQLTAAETKSQKSPVTEADLREERRKRELRWHGNQDGYEVVRKESEVAWDERFEGWLNIFEVNGPEER